MGVRALTDKLLDNNTQNEPEEFVDIFSSSSFNNTESSVSTPVVDDFSDDDIPDLSGIFSSYKIDDEISSKPTIERKKQDVKFDDINDIYAQYIPEKKKRNSGKHPVRNAFIVILCLFIAITSTFGYLAYHKFNSILSSVKKENLLGENTHVKESSLYYDSKQINILLVGFDHTDGDNQDADSVILLTIDHKNSQFKIVSFSTDVYVHIAGGTQNTLKSAYISNGIQGLVDTLELNYKVQIPYYVTFNLNSLGTVANALGGVSVDTTDNSEYLSAIIKAAISKELYDFIKSAEIIAPLLTSNLTNNNLQDIFLDALKYEVQNYTICKAQIPSANSVHTEIVEGDNTYYFTDVNKSSKELQVFLANKQG